MTHCITNFETIATTEPKREALEILESGYRAIDTYRAIRDAIHLDGTTLTIKDHTYTLKPNQKISIIGFGKAACRAAEALEDALHDTINAGIVISNVQSTCEIISTYHGSHPRPSNENVTASGKLIDLARGLTEEDIVLVVVSGGGSALLCWPESECTQGQKLYDSFLRTGGTIQEMNTVRKHISQLKGGGLAKLLYPARVVGLIFSDIPGGNYDMIASGPTYYDHSTRAEAEGIIKKYGLGEFELTETPKEQRWFKNVDNIPIISNETALLVMQQTAENLGYETLQIGHDLYDEPKQLVKKFFSVGSTGKTVIIGGGEARLEIPKHITHSTGGRNSYTALVAASLMVPNSVFISAASDGIDNGKAAGGCIDYTDAQAILADPYYRNTVERFDSYEIIDRHNGLFFTGSTQANVSDLYILLKY